MLIRKDSNSDEEKSVGSSSSNEEWGVLVGEESGEDEKGDLSVAKNSDKGDEYVAKAIAQTLDACASAIDSLMEEAQKDGKAVADITAGMEDDTIEGTNKTQITQGKDGEILPFVIDTGISGAGGSGGEVEGKNDMEASALTIQSVPTDIVSLEGLSREMNDKVTDNKQATPPQPHSSSATSTKEDHASVSSSTVISFEEIKRHCYHRPTIFLLLLTSVISMVSTTAVVVLARDRNAWKNAALELKEEFERIRKQEEETRIKMEHILALNMERDSTVGENPQSGSNQSSETAKEQQPSNEPSNYFFDTASEKCSASANNRDESSSFVLNNCWIQAKISISSGMCFDKWRQKSRSFQKDVTTLFKRVNDAAQESFGGAYYQEAAHNTTSDTSNFGRSYMKEFSKGVRSMMAGGGDYVSKFTTSQGTYDTNVEEYGDTLDFDTIDASERMRSSSPSGRGAANEKEEQEQERTTSPFVQEVSKFLNTVGEGYFFFLDEEDGTKNNVDESTKPADNQKPSSSKVIPKRTTSTMESEVILEEKIEQVAESIKQGISSIFDLVGGIAYNTAEILHDKS